MLNAFSLMLNALFLLSAHGAVCIAGELCPIAHFVLELSTSSLMLLTGS